MEAIIKQSFMEYLKNQNMTSNEKYEAMEKKHNMDKRVKEQVEEVYKKAVEEGFKEAMKRNNKKREIETPNVVDKVKTEGYKENYNKEYYKLTKEDKELIETRKKSRENYKLNKINKIKELIDGSDKKEDLLFLIGKKGHLHSSLDKIGKIYGGLEVKYYQEEYDKVFPKGYLYDILTEINKIMKLGLLTRYIREQHTPEEKQEEKQE